MLANGEINSFFVLMYIQIFNHQSCQELHNTQTFQYIPGNLDFKMHFFTLKPIMMSYCIQLSWAALKKMHHIYIWGIEALVFNGFLSALTGGDACGHHWLLGFPELSGGPEQMWEVLWVWSHKELLPVHSQPVGLRQKEGQKKYTGWNSAIQSPEWWLAYLCNSFAFRLTFHLLNGLGFLLVEEWLWT